MLLVLALVLTLGVSLPAASQGLGNAAKDAAGTVGEVRDAIDDAKGKDDDKKAEEDEKAEAEDDDKKD
jgi:Sec-independent protein translocase protein TatA